MRTSSLADPSTGQPAGRAPGMSPAQAASRLAAGGPNVLPAPPDPAVAPRRGPIPGPLVVVLSAAAVLTNLAYPLGAAALLLAIWEAWVVLGRVPLYLVPPPSSVIAACRTVTAIPLAAPSRRAALTRRCTVSTSGGPSMNATLRWPNSAT